MSESVFVSTKKELERALENKVEKIVVIDPKIAKNIQLVKKTPKVALTAAIATLGIAVTNFWNPVGLTAGFVGAVTGGTVVTALIFLGIGAAYVWAIYNDYDIKAERKVIDANGVERADSIVLSKKRTK